MIESVFIFIFGSIVGSFLNVCIHRLPLNESIVFPASHCTSCNKPIPWYYNIPLVSYLALGGKCRFCKAVIAFRYFVVELLTAVIFLLLYRKFGFFSFNFVFYAIFVCGLIISTFVDLKHRIIPDEISVGGIIAGFVLTCLHSVRIKPLAFAWQQPLDSLLGIIIGGGIIFSVGYVFDLVYFKLLKKPAIQGETESMGGGDVKLLAMIGAFLGWKAALLTFFLAPFFGIFAGVWNMVVKKDHLIPYGPFLSLAGLACLFWAERILRLLLLQ